MTNTDILKKNELLCPYCLNLLQYKRLQVECHICSRSWLIKNEIPQLQNLQIEDFPSGELSLNLSHKLINLCEEKNWRTAIKEVMDELPEPAGNYFEKYATCQYRASFSLLLEIDASSRVLDYGCGWGLISCSLAPRVSEVVSIDLALNRARFTLMRSRQLGYSNVSVFCAGDTPRLPFSNHSFDIVILNGVLEWFPTFMPGHPGKIQLHQLKEICRILRPGGQLFLAIENRFWNRYWLGQPEVHTLQRWIPLLPRPLGRALSWVASRKDFRVWTYSLGGYMKVLRKAGFKCISSYQAMPEYNFPLEVIPLGSLPARKNAMQDSFFKNYFLRKIVRIFPWVNRLIDRLVYTYWFVARK